MVMQQHTHEELCNLLIQGLEAKDELTILKVLDHQEDATINEVVNRVPVHHVRKLIIEIRNLLSNKLTVNHLKWLQQILATKFSVISSMADSRSIILPLISLLDDRSSPAYYMKVQSLKGKLTLLKQMKESRKTDVPETVVRIPVERNLLTHMDIDAESETESEEDFDEDDHDANAPDDEDDQSDEEFDEASDDGEIEAD